MIPPVGFAIAALTVMLWILWSDSIRARRASQALYAVRVALYLVVSGILILNRLRYPQYFSGGATVAVALAVLVGLGGAFWFARRLVRRI
jgi:asparagine N-glycosylation enzyme membrane subunit Stt3